METIYEIRPGESIGPFRLGMTREEIKRLSILMRAFKDGTGAEFPSVDVNVYYDDAGRCKKIEARVFNPGEAGARFMLAGQPVNNVSEAAARAIFRSIAPGLRYSYSGFGLPAAGIRAVKWESSDDFIYAILVVPPDSSRGEKA